MAAKKPSTGRVFSSPVLAFLRRTPSTVVSPRISSTVVLVRKVIFSFFLALSSMILDALNSSRRWMRKTSSANLASTLASSIAVSPPPTTATFFPLKKNASHVAHPLPPLPKSPPPLPSPSHLARPPAAHPPPPRPPAPPRADEPLLALEPEPLGLGPRRYNDRRGEHRLLLALGP